MKAFHGKQEIKDQYLARIKAHRLADELIKGTYWEKGKGCAVGCTIHGNDHSKYETELGIPRILARLEDGIFEKLPNDLAMEWPEKFLESIKPGSDLMDIWDKFAFWLLVDDKFGVIQFAKSDRARKAIQTIADLYQRKINLEEIDSKTWAAAAAAAYAYVADDAAYAYAADDAAAYAAYAAAAYAAYAAAAYAADDAAAYAADAATTNQIKWRIAQSEKLLELLKEAK